MKPKKRCILITSFILLIGWGSSLVIYLTAGEMPDNPFEEFENSNRFTNGVERMGGKLSLAANDLSKWFDGLWHGENLAYTVAVITFVVGVVYYLIGSPPRRSENEEIRS